MCMWVGMCVCVCACTLLTGHSSGEALRLAVEQPLPQLHLAAAGRSDESNGPLPIGRLVVQRHLLIGQDLVVVDI